MTSPRIRKARASDLAAILELEQLFPSDRMSARSVRRFLRAASAGVYVVPDAARLAAALIVLMRRGSRVARIYSVVVHPAARGQGLAKRLVLRAQQAARGKGCQRMSLEVRADNKAALALYTSLGYARLKTLPGYYDDGADGLRLAVELNRR